MRLFGLIGYPLTHSFSKQYFSTKFVEAGITDAAYELFPIENIALLKQVLLQSYPQLCGLNITIPYKQQVLAYLDDTSGLPKNMAQPACNCIHIKNGKLFGYNTDVVGFEISLKSKLTPQHNSALVLGTGGAAAAVMYVLQKLSIKSTLVSRNAIEDQQIAYKQLSFEIVNSTPLIINCTPVGTFPAVNECPPIPYHAIGKGHYLYDLVYNPAETLFLKKGAAMGATIHNGFDMLQIQAEESWKIWNSL